MSREDRSRKALEALSRSLSASGALRSSLRELRTRAEEVGVRVMDGIVSAVARRPVQTRAELFRRKQAIAAEAGVPEVARPAVVEVAKVEPAKVEVAKVEVAKAEVAKAPSLQPEIRPEEEQLVLLARDPGWSFAHWRLDRARVDTARRRRPTARAVLRVLDPATEAVLLEDAVDPVEGHYYIRNPAPDAALLVTLALVSPAGVKELARSLPVHAPPATPRPVEPPTFVDLAPQAGVLAQPEALEPPPRLDLEAARVTAEVEVHPEALQAAVEAVTGAHVAGSPGAPRPRAEVPPVAPLAPPVLPPVAPSPVAPPSLTVPLVPPTPTLVGAGSPTRGYGGPLARLEEEVPWTGWRWGVPPWFWELQALAAGPQADAPTSPGRPYPAPGAR
jgi:hypothetical protein